MTGRLVFEGFREVGPGAYAELEVDVLEMVVDGTDRKREVFGNRFAGAPGGGHQGDLLFAFGQADG